MTQRGTTKRSIRIDDTLWTAALKVAAGRGEKLSVVIREWLKAYVEKGTK
jgi:membrane protein implicated in regulation of membrane protease activity